MFTSFTIFWYHIYGTYGKSGFMKISDLDPDSRTFFLQCKNVEMMLKIASASGNFHEVMRPHNAGNTP